MSPYNYLVLSLLTYAALRLYTRWQTTPLNFHYKPGTLNDAFLKQSKIRQLGYTPYAFAFNSHLQGIIYTFYSGAHERFKQLQIKYSRELFILKDGGTLAIDWDGGIPEGDGDKRPVLVCISGLGGGTHATYVSNVIREVNKEFKCVFV